jgi:galactokinase
MLAHRPAVASPAHLKPQGFTVRAPGYVSLIGDHAASRDGVSVAVAIEPDLRLHVRRRDDQHVVFRTAGLAAAIRLDPTRPLRPAAARNDWPGGVLSGYQARGWEIPGFEAIFESGASWGVDRQATAAVAAAIAIEVLTGRPLPPLERALLCLGVEREAGTVPGEITEPITVSAARAGHALLVDGRSQALRHLALGSTAVLLLDGGLAEPPGSADLARRSAECLEAARALGQQSLRDVDDTLWQRWHDELPLELQKRAAHVRSEHARVVAFAAALEKHDWEAAGDLMLESHRSLATDFEASCAEIDCLCAATAAQAGVYGCRMSGGDYRRRVVALIESDRGEAIVAGAVAEYRRVTGRAATASVTRAVGAAGLEA